LASGQLVPILPQFVSRSDFYYVYYSSGLPQSRRAKLFINFITAALRASEETSPQRRQSTAPSAVTPERKSQDNAVPRSLTSTLLEASMLTC
jgi:hypothetical protein